MQIQEIKLTFPIPCWKISSYNGLTLIVISIKEISTVACQLWLDAGSCKDPENLSGLAHLFEHLIYSDGDPINPETAIIENAFTSHDFAVHCFKCYPGKLEENLTLLEKAINNPTIYPSLFNKEKSVIQKERLHRIDKLSIFDNIDKLMSHYFSHHSYANTVIGSKESVDKISINDAMAFSNKHGRKAHSVVLAGAISLEEAKNLYEQHFYKHYQLAKQVKIYNNFEPSVNTAYSRNSMLVQLAIPAPTLNSFNSVEASAFAKILRSNSMSKVFPSIIRLGFLKTFSGRRIIRRHASVTILSMLFNTNKESYDKNQIIDAFYIDFLRLPENLYFMNEIIQILENERTIESIRKINDHVTSARYLGWLSSVSDDIERSCDITLCKSTSKQVSQYSETIADMSDSICEKLTQSMKVK